MLKKFYHLVTSSAYLTSILALVSGTALAQLITMGSMPILTRIYSPYEFSFLASVISISAIASVAASLRYDIAIPLAENPREQIDLSVIALIFTTALSGAFLITISTLEFLLPTTISGQKDLFLLSIGLAVSMSYFNIFLSISIKEKIFPIIARTKLIQASAAALLQVALGWLTYTNYGLVIGYIFNYSTGCFLLAFILKNKFQKTNLTSLKNTAKKYSRFPKYSTLEALLNVFSIQIPILLIATANIGAEAGYLILAMQVLQAPMALIGTAVGQAYYAYATDKKNRSSLLLFTNKTTRNLLKISLIPSAFLFVFSPFLFKYIFGQPWVRAGELIQWMCPWFIAQFVTSPISMALHVIGEQKTAMLIQLLGVILRVFPTLIAISYATEYTAETYALSGLFFYAIYYLITIKSLKKHANRT